MKTHLTTKELAELAGISEQAIRKAFLAIVSGEATHWRGAELVIEVTEGNRGRDGKNYQVAVESLPPELLAKYKALNPVKPVLNTDLTVGESSLSMYKTPTSPASTEVPARAFSRDDHWKPWLAANHTHRGIATRRFEVLRRIEQRIADGLTKTNAIYAEILEAREILTPLLAVMDEKEAIQRTGRIPVKSPQTIYDWYRLVDGLEQYDWEPALLPGYKGRNAPFTLKIGDLECSTALEYNAEILQLFMKFYLDKSRRTYTHAYDLTVDEAARRNLGEVPSIGTLKNHLDLICPLQVQDYRREGKDADSYKNAVPSLDRDVSHLVAMQWINGDGWDPKNTWIIFPDGEVHKPVGWFWQDVRSRKYLSFNIAKTETSSSLRLALRRVMRDYGLGVNGKTFHITVDNTHAASAKAMTGQMPNRKRFKQQPNEPLGIYARIGAEYHTTLVAHGQSKPIERGFGIGGLNGLVGKHPKLEEGKAHSPATTTVTLAQYIEIVQECIDKLNNRISRSHAIRGKSPNQAFEESLSQNIVLKATQADINRLLQDIKVVTASRNNGEIRLFENKYWNEALITYAGQELTVEYDRHNLHGSIVVYQLTGEFITEVECKSRPGWDDQDAAADQARLIRGQQKKIRDTAKLQQMIDVLESRKLAGSSKSPEKKPKVVQPVRVESVGGDMNAAKIIPLKTPVQPEDDFDYQKALMAGLAKRRQA